MSSTKSIGDQRVDQQLAAWLHEGPEEGSRQGLERTLAAARAVNQRPRALVISTWLPRSVGQLQLARPQLGLVPLLIILGMLLLLAMAVVYIGTRPRLPEGLGPSADRLMAFQDGTQISVARIDGSGRRAISGDVPFAGSPIFSPDGSKIAFVSSPDASKRGDALFVVAVRGSNEPVDVSHGVVVTDKPGPQISWSPDGSAIAFAGVLRGAPIAPESQLGTSIFVTQADGSAVAQITDDTMDRDLPSWTMSYDGDWIAYRGVGPDGGKYLQYIRPDGSEMRQIEELPSADADFSRVSWSPTNDLGVDPNCATCLQNVWLAYANNFGYGTPGNAVIINPDAGGFYPWHEGIGASKAYGTPWSPDGKWIAILTATDGLVLAEFDPDANGGTYSGELRRLGPIADCWIDWSPDGTALYGGTPNGCTSTVVIPVDDPDSAFETYTPMLGVTSWQPLEP